MHSKEEEEEQPKKECPSN